MPSNRWRRFLPKRSAQTMRQTRDDLFLQAKRSLDELKVTNIKDASSAYKIYRDKDNPSLVDRLVTIVLLTPRAAQAQLDMDTHQGGYRNHKARLFELIEFNDVFVETVLAFPENQLAEFEDRLHALMDDFCKQLNTLMFTDEQYSAIVHGLSREIAVYKAIEAEEGITVKMTSRVQDSKGVDMIVCISDGRCINIDCKTRSSYHFRLIDLKRKGIISEEDRLTAELRGFIVLTKGKRADFVQTTLIRVATQDLGDIRNFVFEDTSKIADLLRTALNTQPKEVALQH